jgi:hypothetical protein
MININSISFDLTDCVERERNGDERFWLDANRVAHVLRFRPEAVDWPFDLTQLEKAREFYGAQCASFKGAMLDLDVLTVDKVELLRGLFKYRSPAPNSMGIMYVGIIWIPFANFHFQINIEAMEQGTTGMREAAIGVLSPEDYPNPEALKNYPVPKIDENAEPIKVSSMEEMFALMRERPLIRIISDDPQFDQMFPSHPLTLVRARMGRVIDTLKIDKMWWQNLKPFRLK